MLEVEVKLPKLRERTQFVFDIKPMNDDYDLNALGEKVKVLTLDGYERIEERLSALGARIRRGPE